AAREKPLLGVCVGEQMLFSHSEEGDVACLDVFPGQVKRFAGPRYAQADQAGETQGRLKIPHMGWNQVAQTRPHALWEGIPDHAYFYFVHSYYVVPADQSLTVGASDYGGNFTCAVARANIFAV